MFISMSYKPATVIHARTRWPCMLCPALHQAAERSAQIASSSSSDTANPPIVFGPAESLIGLNVVLNW